MGVPKNSTVKIPKRVKCAEEYITEDCEQPKRLITKCNNHNEQYPTNYRRCQLSKKLQNYNDDAEV